MWKEQTAICLGTAATTDLHDLQLKINKPRVSLTSAEGEKVRLVGISLQQRRHTAGHALIAFVDEFLAEVVVYLLGCDAVVSRQGAVDELRQLKTRKRILTTNDQKILKARLRWHAVVNEFTHPQCSSGLFIHRSHKRGSEKL